MTQTPVTEPTRSPVARLITDRLDPANWVIAVPAVVGWHVGGLAGLGWGLLGALFSAVIPLLFVTYGIRRGRWTDRHVSVRQHRPVIMIFTLCSVTTGIVLIIACGAPRQIVALIAAMLVALGALTVVTFWWKISVHAAVASGGVAVLALVYGPAVLVAYVVVALVGWSRVALRDHTAAQVLSGAVLGGAVAAATYAFLR